MTRDDIIQIAREAGFVDGVVDIIGLDGFANFAALVAAAERKRLHDKFMEIHKSQQHSNNYWHFAARKIAEET